MLRANLAIISHISTANMFFLKSLNQFNRQDAICYLTANITPMQRKLTCVYI